MKWFGKCRRWLVLGLALGVALVLVALAFPQQVLCVESGPVEGDVIVVLGGGGGDRARRAAELFRAGAAPRVLVSGEGDTVQNQRLLMRHGVPAAAIALEPDSRNTQENARFAAPWLRAGRDEFRRIPDQNGRDEFHLVPNSESQEQDQGRGGTRPYQSQGHWKASLPEGRARRVILVTSWYHSRRALQCFRHYLPGIQFYSRPAYYAYARSEWDREGIRPFIRLEYLKLLAYWVRYGVWPMGKWGVES